MSPLYISTQVDQTRSGAGLLLPLHTHPPEVGVTFALCSCPLFAAHVMSLSLSS
ncbi:expressed unknown protein [Ectocarpus siliculosus]|uniref:Uncharacterized protein n=1 Tax=Ectocarpus siliculosus TaxID=2880 RepID=D8LS63_ECTSI|nr:expressed unknown protein [Ectocarpus siliculosus]|eukprot:CBN75120.1 expressed unknown protein [Ectocarpus siliculosus]